MLTERADIDLLMKAAAFAKIPPENLKPDHPWSFTGKTAELLQMAVETIDPVKAAEWRSAAGGTISLATQAAELGLQPHTKATKEDLLKHDPRAVIQQQAAQDEWVSDQLKDMDEKWRKSYESRTGQSADDYDRPNFGGGWQGESMRRQYELDQAMSGSWN